MHYLSSIVRHETGTVSAPEVRTDLTGSVTGSVQSLHLAEVWLEVGLVGQFDWTATILNNEAIIAAGLFTLSLSSMKIAT